MVATPLRPVPQEEHMTRLQFAEWILTRNVCRALLLITAIASLPGRVAADTTWKNVRQDCGDATKKFSFSKAKSCTVDLFTARTFHLTAGSVVPGGGIGLGGLFTRNLSTERWTNDFTLTGISSFTAFWMTNGVFTFEHHRMPGSRNTAKDLFTMHFYGRARGLPLLPFYGIGPGASRNSKAQFEQRDAHIGFDTLYPMSDWFGVGGRFEGIIPGINQVAANNSIEKTFTEITAPGLTQQPGFLHYEFWLHPHYPGNPPYYLEYNIGYGYYHAVGSTLYSFRRFKADFVHTIYPQKNDDKSPNRDAYFTLHALLSVSSTSSGEHVPFYLQESLGGYNIDNQATLRGFSDFRFRGPNLLLLQGDYDRRVWKYLGVLAFYDAGKVTTQRSDLNFKALRQDYGGGLTAWIGGKVVFTAGVGLGTSEAPRAFFSLTGLF
jgi:hypothetical protein